MDPLLERREPLVERTVVAIVEQGGMPRDTLTVARFTAPAWRVPARPRSLRARRTGTSTGTFIARLIKGCRVGVRAGYLGFGRT